MTSPDPNTMQGENRERWQTLCEEAATEQDPERLLLLIQEINRLLESKEQQLSQAQEEKTAA